MATRLEHANMTVRNLEEATAFLTTAFPEFRVRHQGRNELQGHRWAHVGTDDFYIALQEPHEGTDPRPDHRPYVDFGVNHIGWVVDDFDAVIERLEAAGYERGMVPSEHKFRKRAYYYDGSGYEWEFIEYLSEDPAERNEYTD